MHCSIRVTPVRCQHAAAAHASPEVHFPVLLKVTGLCYCSKHVKMLQRIAITLHPVALADIGCAYIVGC